MNERFDFETMERSARSKPIGRLALVAGGLILLGGVAILIVSNVGPPGEGRLRVEVSDLPAGAAAQITVTGPEGFDTQVDRTTTLENLVSGHYSVVAEPVARDDATFYPTITGAPASVSETVTPEVGVAYRTEVPDVTQVLEGQTLDSLISVSRVNGTLVFAGDAVPVDEGDIVVAGVSRKTPLGLLRRVIDVDQENDRAVVRTEQASLDEAVTRGEVALQRSLSFDQVERADALVDGVDFQKGSLVVTIEGTAGRGLSIACGPGVQVRAEGRIELDPDFDLSASWGLFDGLEAKATVTTDQEAEVSLSASGAARCSKEVELYRLHFAPITVAVGPAPVVVTPLLTVNLDVDGSVASELSVGAVQRASLTAGLAYDDGRVTAIKDFHSEFDKPRVEVSPAVLSATAAAGPRLDLLLYGVVGPSLQAQGYLRLDVAPLERPWWDLFGGLKASARISLDILSGRIKVNLAQADVIKWETRVASAKGPPPLSRAELLNATLPSGICRWLQRYDYADVPPSPKLIDGDLPGIDHQTYGSRIWVEEDGVFLEDIDGDGKIDGLIDLHCTAGGSSTTDELWALLSSSGGFVRIPYGTDLETEYGVELSPEWISDLIVQDDGTVVVEYPVWESGIAWDAHCCPSRSVTESIVFSEGRFVRESVSVGAPSVDLSSPHDVGHAFYRAWVVGDSDAMHDLAVPEVVSAAQRFGRPVSGSGCDFSGVSSEVRCDFVTENGPIYYLVSTERDGAIVYYLAKRGS